MAYYKPLSVADTFNPLSLLETPLLQNPGDHSFGYHLFQEPVPETLDFDFQSLVTKGPSPGIYNHPVHPQENPCISPALLTRGRDEHYLDLFQDWVDPYHSPASSMTHASPEPMFAPWAHLDSLCRSAKRENFDSASSKVSSVPSSSFPSRASRKTETMTATPTYPSPTLPKPIKVPSPTLPRCPMPNCGVEIEDRDSAWRGHFKRCHHADLCRTPGCRGAGSCRAPCPCPLTGPDSKRCGHGKEMTIESVGRHLLNVHIKVMFRCPVCGLENAWREWACARHIRMCVERHGREAAERSDFGL